MIDIENYMEQLMAHLNVRFGSRLLYVGLQGSYLRGEANEHSDIDIMVILDRLEVADLKSYRDEIESLAHPDKSCGFICGKADMATWNPLEICHLLHSTRDYYGELRAFVPTYTDNDIRNFVKMSVNNLYHEICHRHIHAKAEKTAAALPGIYKGVFFILQNRYYLTHGRFPTTKAELLRMTQGLDRAVMERAAALNKGISFDFEDSFALLFTWCQETMKSL